MWPIEAICPVKDDALTSPTRRLALQRQKGFPFRGKPFVADDSTYLEFSSALLLLKAKKATRTLDEGFIVVRVLQCIL
jgi:hypothetical protein